MKITAPSLLAMLAGWALPLIGMAAGQLVTSGRTSDIGATAMWVGLFAAFGWLAVVLPIMSRFGSKRVFSDIRLSWLGWAALAVAVFAALALPIMGHDAFSILWYPATMGGISGIVFALLVRRNARQNA